MFKKIGLGGLLGGSVGAGIGAALGIRDKKRSAAQVLADQRAAAQKTQEQKLRDLVASGPGYQSSIDFAEFGKLKDYAYGAEDSPYAKLLREQATQQTSQGVDRAAKDAQASLSNVYNQLAMGGGLSGGARERLASDSGIAALTSRQDVRRSGDEAQMGIGLQEAQQKQKAQENVLNAMQTERKSKAQFEMDQWKMKADQEAAIMKAQAERDIAAANSCLLEGTAVKMASGHILKVEDLGVGDVLPGGIIYTIQKSLAPDTLFDVNGTLMTGGHAVLTESGWRRAHDVGVIAVRPAGKGYIYNFGVTKHFITLADGSIVGDLHETDDYEFISDEESLERMNREIALR
jgi:hypothetical protein